MCEAGNLGREAKLQEKEGPWQEADVGVQPWDMGNRDSVISCLSSQGTGGIRPRLRTGLE